MARFTRTGGEALAVAVRVARAASGKNNIAICGYHGWHDWYLSANLSSNSKLNSHLLKGLEVNGVPKKLKNTIYPFEYNNIKQIKNKICLAFIFFFFILNFNFIIQLLFYIYIFYVLLVFRF
jgi:glutamate-1-semialdehyde aminotransferase